MIQRKTQRRRGSTLVEFALIAPLLLVISMGILQYGIITNATNTLTQISREGARYAAINPGTNTVPNDGATGTSPGPAATSIRGYIKSVCAPTTIRYADIADAGGGGTPAGVTITTPDTGGRIPGNRIVVSIRYPMSRKLFVPTRLMGFKVFPDVYTSTSTFVIE